MNFRRAVTVFLAQSVCHFVWYADVRACLASMRALPVALDTLYTVLSLFVLRSVLADSGRENWIALILGGAVGTYAGLTWTV